MKKKTKELTELGRLVQKVLDQYVRDAETCLTVGSGGHNNKGYTEFSKQQHIPKALVIGIINQGLIPRVTSLAKIVTAPGLDIQSVARAAVVDVLKEPVKIPSEKEVNAATSQTVGLVIRNRLEQFRTRRHKGNIGISGLSKKANLTPLTVSKIIHGQTFSEVRVICRIAAAIDVLPTLLLISVINDALNCHLTDE